jgi:hypothetical protein
MMFSFGSIVIDKAYADNGNCPGCWAWKSDGSYHIIACLKEPPEVAFYFGVELVWPPDALHGHWWYEWNWVLMVEGSDSCCDSPCHEYTAAFSPGLIYEDFGWMVSDGYTGPDPLGDHIHSICGGNDFETVPPIWLNLPTSTPTVTPTP